MAKIEYIFNDLTKKFALSVAEEHRNNLYKSIVCGDTELAKKCADILLQDFCDMFGEDKLFAKEIIYYFWAQINIVVNREGVSFLEIRDIQQYYYQKMEQAKNVEDMIQLAKNQIIEFTELFEKCNFKNKNSEFIEQICQFVNKHIYDNISPFMIATKLNYNKLYVSRRFKNEMGITLGQYIRNVKVEEAKRLINSGKSLQIIADMLGFSSQSYFTNVFKKEVGITPSQYYRQNA